MQLCTAARAKAHVEPALALLSTAMSEAVGNDITLRAPLQGVVTDGGGGAQGRLDVALLDERRLALALEIFVLTIGPDARKAVGLQLDLDLDVICFRLAAGNALRVLRLRQNAEEVLHVMTDFVGDHVGLRELA